MEPRISCSQRAGRADNCKSARRWRATTLSSTPTSPTNSGRHGAQRAWRAGAPIPAARPHNNERERAVSDLTFAQSGSIAGSLPAFATTAPSAPATRVLCRYCHAGSVTAAMGWLRDAFCYGCCPTPPVDDNPRCGPVHVHVRPPLFAGQSSLRRAWQAASSQQHPHGIFVPIGIVSWREPDSG